MVHDFDNYKSALSEGKALAVVVQAVPGNPHWTWVGTDSPVRRRPCVSASSEVTRRAVAGAPQCSPSLREGWRTVWTELNFEMQLIQDPEWFWTTPGRCFPSQSGVAAGSLPSRSVTTKAWKLWGRHKGRKRTWRLINAVLPGIRDINSFSAASPSRVPGGRRPSHHPGQ